MIISVTAVSCDETDAVKQVVIHITASTEHKDAFELLPAVEHQVL